jgi:hypothetical protein
MFDDRKDLNPNNLDRYILRYKVIYSLAALILGFAAVISGLWLGSLEAYRTEVSGWMLNVFGCAILYNDNNMAPSFFLVLDGLFLISITQYKLRTNRQSKKQVNLDERTLRQKFFFSISGLFAGFFSTLFGIVLAENGGNACPTAWAEMIISYEKIFFVGVIFFLVGIIVVTTTRYRIRISNKLESVTPIDL